MGVGTTRVSLPYRDGVVCIGGQLYTESGYVSDASGRLEIPLPVSLIPAAIGWKLQVAYIDAPPFAVNFSDALELTFRP